MFQHVGENHYIVRIRRMKLFEKTGVNGKSFFPCDRGGGFIQFQSLSVESISTVYLQAASFVAAYIEESTRPLRPVKRNVSINNEPQTIYKGEMKPLPYPRIKSISLASEVVVALIKRL